MKNIKWDRLVANVLAGAASGYVTTGSWEGAVATALALVAGLLQKKINEPDAEPKDQSIEAGNIPPGGRM